MLKRAGRRVYPPPETGLSERGGRPARAGAADRPAFGRARHEGHRHHRRHRLGKSSAARHLASRGAHLIDADRLAHRAYEPGTRTYRALLSAFGTGILGENGRIDRPALAGRVFGRPESLRRLGELVWPEVRRLARARLSALRRSDPEGVVVLEAALLFEAGWDDLVDEVWVVTAGRETALRRAMARDGSDEAAVRRRIDAQLPDRERVRRAHVVIANHAGEERLRQRLDEEWRRVAPPAGAS